MSPLVLLLHLLPLELPRELTLPLLQLLPGEPAAHVALQRQDRDGHLRLQPLVAATREPAAATRLD